LGKAGNPFFKEKGFSKRRGEIKKQPREEIPQIFLKEAQKETTGTTREIWRLPKNLVWKPSLKKKFLNWNAPKKP